MKASLMRGLQMEPNPESICLVLYGTACQFSCWLCSVGMELLVSMSSFELVNTFEYTSCSWLCLELFYVLQWNRKLTSARGIKKIADETVDRLVWLLIRLPGNQKGWSSGNQTCWLRENYLLLPSTVTWCPRALFYQALVWAPPQSVWLSHQCMVGKDL